MKSAITIYYLFPTKPWIVYESYTSFEVHFHRLAFFRQLQLSFKRDDLITVTQIEEGGWWEGTSHESGKTGWFPSNYVKEIDHKDLTTANDSSNPVDHAIEEDEQLKTNQAMYRQQLINELKDKELDFIQELRALTSDYLQPMNASGNM